MRFQPCKGVFWGIVLVLAAGGLWPEEANTGSFAALNSAQIVEQMQLHNLARTEGLKQYKALRHYSVVYKGYSATIAASMDVEVNYDALSGKSFRIVSESGSKFLLDKVLKRAVDSEEEASRDQGATALTEANYRIHLVGNESVAGRPAYILDVDPLTPSKFLYRGKIWVDAADFALVKIEAQPGKNPSLWIARTQIRQSFAKTDNFWLPEQNRSETSVRIGGTAVLIIDYGLYQVVPDVAIQGAGARTSAATAAISE
jgi:hypothetical protein